MSEKQTKLRFDATAYEERENDDEESNFFDYDDEDNFLINVGIKIGDNQFENIKKELVFGGINHGFETHQTN